jgi:hypothetical protein
MRAKKALRKCLRCGCTDDRACGCGCEWVLGADVCSACLTDGEHTIWSELLEAKHEAKRPVDVRAEEIQCKIFYTYLMATSLQRPLPRRLTQDFQTELYELKQDRKYPETKPQFSVMHDAPRAAAKKGSGK